MANAVEELIHQIETEPTLRQRLASALITPESKSQPTKISYQQFLEWADEDTLAEWVNGDIVMSSPASYWHQHLVRFLTSLLGMYVETRELGAIYPAPFQMKLEFSGREPDILFIKRTHFDRVKNSYLEGPADLIIEIISPESVGRDRGEKFYEYEEGGVPEFWLIDPLRKWTEFYQLSSEGHYKTVFAGQEGIYHSAMIQDFWLRVEWLWQDSLPHPLRALGEITGIDSETIERFLDAVKGKQE